MSSFFEPKIIIRSPYLHFRAGSATVGQPEWRRAGAWAPRALARRPDVLGSRAGPIAGARGTPARGPSSGCGGASTRRRHGSTSTTAALVEPKGNAAAAPVPIGKLSSCLGHYMVSHRFLLYFRGFVQPASLSLLDCSGSTTRKGGEKARKEGDLC
jgi:hypothetical protein